MVSRVGPLVENEEGEVLGELEDGTPVLFRRITPEDKELLQSGFQMLSPQSRYRRFFSMVDHLSQKQLRYFTEVDFVDHYAWIAEVPGGMGLGVARWIRLKDEPEVAEGAVTVVDTFHNRGIGKALLWLGVRSAIAAGIRAIRVSVLSENDPVLTWLREAGAGPGRWSGGVLEVDIPLPQDVAELERSPLPEVFRATAMGQLTAQVEPEGRRANVKHVGGLDGEFQLEG
jgi:GNAT superfamily N-acetyltransferase